MSYTTWQLLYLNRAGDRPSAYPTENRLPYWIFVRSYANPQLEIYMSPDDITD